MQWVDPLFLLRANTLTGLAMTGRIDHFHQRFVIEIGRVGYAGFRHSIWQAKTTGADVHVEGMGAPFSPIRSPQHLQIRVLILF